MAENNDPSILSITEPTIFERGSKGRDGVALPSTGIEQVDVNTLLPVDMIRDEIDGLPEVSEVETVRHYTRLSQLNYGVDNGFYPLGSCTMKYNPKVNEDVARYPGFSGAHPYQPVESVQGNLSLMYELESLLGEITALPHVTLQPAAGAHGEMVGMMMIRAYHEDHGNPRTKVLIPDTAHGTNPASSALCGYKVVPIASNDKGILDAAEVERVMDEEVAALMLTNPNTLGLFEENILEIAKVVHDKGGLIYCDGANMNALMGIAKPGDMGVDVLHLNLHKTFSTPHGGGGPGAGPVCVTETLAPYLPAPVIVKSGDKYSFNDDRPKSIGRVKAFYGNFGILVRAYAYIRTMSAEGLKRVSETALINANYIKERLKEYYDLPYDLPCMHECVFSDKKLTPYGIKTLDVAKRLIDYGFHPPTIYFPLVVNGAIMIEPTETESRQTIDWFCDAMINIAKEAEREPELLKEAPTKAACRRLDEVKAAREPKLRWQP
ncbi:MAG: aminomethyl-transferring glycine dehydrogenase subunit GcvPB [Proteobacteria bacterium]|nr:aminomethyl-transferring glycine dehydrogenase subunit GcvPB [Pseudomonadota bacterium]